MLLHQSQQWKPSRDLLQACSPKTSLLPVPSPISTLKWHVEDASMGVRPVLKEPAAVDVVLSQHFVSRELLTRGPWSTPECGTHL